MSVATLLLRAEQARSVVPSLVVAEDPDSSFRQLWKDQVLIWKDGG